MIVIGLTGGIASGKTTVARLLGERGARVIDADRLGHRAYEPGCDAHTAVAAAFGDDVIAADGTIDRKALGSKVFGKPDQLKRLTAIVWPEIRRLAGNEISEIARQDPNAIIVLEAAVLLEAGWESLVDEIWVTIVDRKTAIARAVERGGLDEEAAGARIDSQLSNDERQARAQVVLENAGDLSALDARVEEAWLGLRERTS
ncbi:MAG: dephospho-CoA kinase [Deltaproteobacteria bacterium]|nr:dephospho-CoA kinase [Deltaproteobacteria bacterium]